MKRKDHKCEMSGKSQPVSMGENCSEDIYRSLKQDTGRKKWELDEIISKTISTITNSGGNYARPRSDKRS
jgi:hypothetical protein